MSCKYILGNKEYTEQEILSYINDNKNAIVKENRIEKVDSVYINKDIADDSVLLHEFSHIFSKWQKENRPELWKKGQDLAKDAIKSGEIKEIENYVKQTQPKLKEGSETFYDEVLQEFIGRESKNMMDEQKQKSPLMQWLSDFWASIKDLFSLTSMTPEQIANLSLRDFARASVVDLLKGERIRGEQAQEYFVRNADRLPLTLSVFNRPEFKKLQGKEVNSITVLNSLNQTGIKQIEKDSIKKIIEDNYQGQNKINYDELEATVRANIMPLERIETSSYANYGMDNLGDGNYGEAKTLILNAPIEHGVTGHFSGDFKASGRKNIKYQPKQLDTNTWVAVEEGYESQANDNNIYQYVGTAGTKEAVDRWIENYDLDKQLLDKKVDENINKGMFGHIRVWQDGETFTVSELQSDYFQKNNARQSFITKNEEYKKINFKISDLNIEMISFVPSNLSIMPIYGGINKWELRGLSTVRQSVKLEDLVKMALKETNNLDENNQNEINRLVAEKGKLEKEQNNIYDKLSPQEKQFIASQKEWEKRMVREVIKEASLSGATSLRFPTPYTLSVIEGYIKDMRMYDNNNDYSDIQILPYNIITKDLIEGSEYLGLDGNPVRLNVGDLITMDSQNEYSTFIVVETINNSIKVRGIDNNRSTQSDPKSFKEIYGEDLKVGFNKIGDLEYYWKGVEGDFTHMINFLTENTQTLEQPTYYLENIQIANANRQATRPQDSFSIEDDLSETQQTVAYKYLEIAEILKNERGEDNVEIVTDENGFDWYETKIEASEVNNPVVAFQNKAGITKAEAIKRNNGNPLNLAPNGKPSILYQSYKDLGYSEQEAETLTAQVYSDYFINNFFGDWLNDPQNASKVVDENGQPMIYFHGTGVDFTEFKKQNMLSGEGAMAFGTGFYFTPSKLTANTYRKKASSDIKGGKIIATFLNIKKPMYWEDNIEKSDRKKIDEYLEDNRGTFLPRISKTYGNAYKHLSDQTIGGKENFVYRDNTEINDFLQEELGFDSISHFTQEEYEEDSELLGRMYQGADEEHFIVFNPNQIKSATENVGTFSTESNDIRYQIIGEQGASRIEEYNNLLNQAKELEKQGKDYSQTGWYKNDQGQWKYFSNEILNEFIDLPQIKNKTVNLKDLLKPNSLLLQAYPQLENTKIEFYEGTKGADFRADANTNGTIIQNGDETTLHIRTDSKTKPDVRRIVAHELNHKIQSIENFPRGGRPESFLKFANQITGIELTNDFQDYKNKMLSFDGNTLSKEDRGIVKILQDYLKNDRNSKDYFYDKYLLLQGEIDSRAVELALTLKDIYGTQQNFSYINIVKALAKQENNPSIIDQAIDLFYEDINTTSQTKVIEPQPNFNGYPTYKEAVDNTPLNEDIEIRIDDVVLGSVNANNEINDLIRQGIIEDKRELQPNGDIVFVTTGTNLESKIISGLIAKEVLGGIVNKAGDVRVKQKVAAPEVFDTFEKNRKEYGEYDALSLLAAEELERNTSAFGVERFITEEIDIPSETVLMSKLKNLLNQLGVKAMNLDAWEKRFGQKASSNALADIANRIVAFAEGNFNIDTLSEETAHFIIEALDQETLKPLLDLVHKTEEWKEYSQTYMEIYNGNEALVRKEILGKVLKNSLQNRAKQQETLQGQSVVDRIVQYFNEFIESVRNLFTEDYKKQLKQFNDEIYEKLISEELFNELNPQQFEGNKIVMYQTQLSDTVWQSISKFKDRMIIEDRKVGGLHQISLNNVTIDEYNEVAQLEAIATLASIMKKHIEFLNKRGKKQGFLSVNEHSVYDATIELGAILQEIKPKISNATSFRDKERALKSSDEAINELSNLTANLNQEKVNKFKEIIDRVGEENNLSQQQKDVLYKEIETQERDANQFYVWFGGAINAQNPIVNMLAKLFRKMNNETTVTFSKEVNEFFSKIGGVKQEEVASILKTFKRGNYLFSPYNFDDFLRDESKIRLEVYKQVDPETYNTISKDVENKEEDFLKNYSTYKKALRGEYYNKYRLLTKEAIDKAGIKIDALSKDGRKEYLDMFNSLNLSEETRIVLQLNKDRKSKIIQEQKRNGGASAEDNQQLKEIQIEYNLDTSPYDSNGELYKGLDIVDGNVVLVEGYTKEKLKQDALLKKEKPKALIALELNEYSRALTQFYSGKGKSVFEGFYNTAIKNTDVGELNMFIDLNTRAFFTQEFWQTKDESLVKKLRDLNTEESLKLAKSIEKKNNKLKNVLKKNKLYNRPSEINFNSMNSADISEVKDLSTHLETDYNSAKKLLDKEEFKEESDKKYTSNVNEAYIQELSSKDVNRNDFQQLLPFLYEHTTNQSYNSILRMEDKIRKYAGNGIIKGLNATEEELQANPNEVLIKYAQSKLLPYFKKTEGIDNPYDKPIEMELKEQYLLAIRENKGYQELERIYEQFKKDHFIDISPNFIFEDVENSDRLNPEYKRRIENNEPLINLEAKDKNGKLLYKNQEFFDHFGITNFGDVATKNQEEYKIWEALMEMHEKTLNYTNKGKHNKYLLPQYRRGLLARAKDTAKNFSVDKLKESLKDVLTYREDDPMLGMTKDGVAQSYSKTDLIIPRTGFNLLDSEEEVTDELLYSYMLMLQEGIKYQKRTEAWSEVEAMEHFLKSKKYGDKIGEKTKVYDLFKGFVNDNLYGQRESFDVQTDAFGLLSKKQSLAPVLNLFQKFIRVNNLMFSVLTPMTSFFQGSVNYYIEKYLGDRIDKDAARLARKDLPKLLSEAMSEFLDVKANAKLNLLFQFMGQENPSERFKNSNSGKVARLLNLEKSGYFTHYVAGVPLDAKIMLTTLNDFRIVDNSVMDFYTFRRKNRGMTNAESRAEWKNYEDNTLYKNIEFDEKIGNFKPSKNLENIPNYQNAIQKARDKVTLAKSDIDNQLTEGDKGIMARHALLSFFTLHKGWLITSITKRWKSTHLNMLNGRMEEGSHSGALKFVTGFVKDIIKKDKDGKRRTLTEAWKENFKEYDGGYKLKEEKVYDDTGKKLLRVKYIPVDENNVEVANITKMTDLRISGNKVYSKTTYKGNNWSNLQEVSVDIVNDKYVTNTGVEITSDSVGEVMKDYFEELKYDFSEMRKLSIRRAFIDWAVASVLASLGILLSQLADDDEDDFVKEAVAYASFRLASEFSSQSVALPAQAYAFLESPTVGMSQLQNSLDVLDVFDGDEINRGTFKGLSKREAWFVKMLPGLKEYNKISNIDRTRQSYEFFNEKNLKWVVPAYQMLSEEKEK